MNNKRVYFFCGAAAFFMGLVFSEVLHTSEKRLNNLSESKSSSIELDFYEYNESFDPKTLVYQHDPRSQTE